MKHNFVLVFLNVMAVSVYSQTSFVASISNDTRMNLVRASIPLTKWHEQSFWAQYSNYLSNIQPVSSQTFAAVQKSVRTKKTDIDSGAFENGCNIIACRFNELKVKREYFIEISREHNGIVGMQFLQTEVILEMIERLRIYDESSLRNFRFLPKAFSVEKRKQAKHNSITNALSLSPEEAAIFFSVYSRYEQECDDIMGEEYDLYELFSAEASDFTPAMAKNQGYDLLTLIDRELKLKEKYFVEMSRIVGPSLATRFLAWEDYYSVTCKMFAMVSDR